MGNPKRSVRGGWLGNYLGQQFEIEVFGKRAKHPRKLKRMERASAFRQAKRAQKKQFCWDPRRPQSFLGRALYNAVRDELPKEWRERLRFYAAVGTKLDLLGVDGFFTLERRSTATIDLALRRHGWKRSIRADILVTRDDFANRNALSQVAKSVVRKLLPTLHAQKLKRLHTLLGL